MSEIIKHEQEFNPDLDSVWNDDLPWSDTEPTEEGNGKPEGLSVKSARKPSTDKDWA